MTVPDQMPRQISDAVEAINRGVFLTILVVVLTCVVFRWVLPPALRVLRRCVQDLIDVAAACLVLPEYWVSTTTRRRAGDPPPLLAYEYGYAVGRIAHVTHTVVGQTFTVAARVAGGTPPLVIGFVAGALEIGVLAGWL